MPVCGAEPMAWSVGYASSAASGPLSPWVGGSNCPDSSARARVLRCQGVDGMVDEVLYLSPQQQHGQQRGAKATARGRLVKGNVVFLPGDVQDLHHRMLAAGHGEWSDYSLESTARVLANKFPEHAVWVVTPTAHLHGKLASYDNFARTDWASGGAVPHYRTDGSASLHLEALLNAAADAVESGRTEQGGRPDVHLPLTLVGFSKGTVVLNQLVTELACEVSTPRGGTRTKYRRSCGARVCRKRPRVSSTERLLSVDATGEPPTAEAVGDGASWIWPLSGGGDAGGCEDGGVTGKQATARPEADEDKIRSPQHVAGSIWSRLLSLGGYPFSSASTLSSASLGSTTDESQENDDSDCEWKSTPDAEQDRAQAPSRERVARKPSASLRVPTYGAAGVGDEAFPKTFAKRRKRERSTLPVSPEADASSGPDYPHRRKGHGGGVEEECCGAARRLFDRVAAIHWVDGGNGGLTGSFPTNPACLASLAARPNLAIRVHGTPYQWDSPCRPWLAFERDAFLSSLEEFGAGLDGQEGLAFGTSIDVGGGGKGREVRSSRRRMALGAAAGGSRSRSSAVRGRCSARGMAVAKGEGKVGAACGVKRLFYFENEEPSLGVHFQALRELNPE